MRKEIQPFHNDVLAAYQADMFDSLIHKHNITTESSKSYVFENKQESELKPLRGYFAMKDMDGKRKKYFIEEMYYEDLPIRVDKQEEMFFKESSRTKGVIVRPIELTPFRIKPEKCWDNNKEFIDVIAPFSHSQPLYWTLNKIVAIMGYIGKTFCGVCSLSEFGKSSIYLILDSLTKKVPVFQPRSVPGVLVQITEDGNMVFDEVHGVAKEVKDCMENFSLQVAGNSPIYINGAMRAKNTKPRYNVPDQSITYLYNVYSNYRDPESSFWNYIWKNRKAMESRFLCLKFEGELTEEFDKEFSIPDVAKDNRMLYIKIAKHLLWLKKEKKNNTIKRRYINSKELSLKKRHKIIYDEITWGIDQYSSSQEEYDELIKLLNTSITSYEAMLSYNKDSPVRYNPASKVGQTELYKEEQVK